MTKSPAPPFLASYGNRTPTHSAASNEQRMWGSVILRAIVDAIWVDPAPDGRLSANVDFGGSVPRKVANRLRDEAVFWLTLDNIGFHQVCERAGLEPDAVRKAFLNATAEDKARWSAADLSLHDLQRAGQLRD